MTKLPNDSHIQVNFPKLTDDSLGILAWILSLINNTLLSDVRCGQHIDIFTFSL